MFWKFSLIKWLKWAGARGSPMASTSSLAGGKKWLQNSWCFLPSWCHFSLHTALKVLSSLSSVLGTMFLCSLSLFASITIKSPKVISHPYALHIAVSCRTSSISVNFPPSSTIHPAPETFGLGPLEFTVCRLQDPQYPQPLLECSFSFSVLQSFLVNTFQFLKIRFSSRGFL